MVVVARIACFLIVALATSAALAQADRLDPVDATPDEIIAHSGLGGRDGCLQFVTPSAVEARKARWAHAIDAIGEGHRDYLLGWVIGAQPPPKRVAIEAKKQLDCMIARMVVDAADPETSLVLDWQKARSRKAQMKQLHRRFARDSRYARRLIDTITESTYRDARSQSWIWRRKFVFSGRNFNYVSAHAATVCGLDAGHSWKPGHGTHRGCWFDRLSPEEREREILQASAAPGISRHHWGTEFDLFGLNPALFRGAGRLADEWEWMDRHGYEFGFYQPYGSGAHITGHRYMEERWHWSYYPVGQALLEWARQNDDAVAAALTAQWDHFESTWTSRGTDPEFFGFVRQSWRDFMFNVEPFPRRDEASP